MLEFETSVSWDLKFNSNILVRNDFFLKNCFTSAVSHNDLDYHYLSIARYKVSFYAINYFE